MIFNMYCIYDSERFTVVHVTYGPTEADAVNGFELVDKRGDSVQEVFLHGLQADAFAFQIKVWQVNTPAFEEVEQVLEDFTILGRLPVISH